MKNSKDSWTIPQQQAVVGLIIFFYKTAITVIKGVWPLFVVVILRGKSNSKNEFLWVLIGITILVLLRSILGFIFFRFYIDGNFLIIRKGVFKRQTLSIPLKSIQGVNIEQSLLHQVLNIAKLKIDTAGSEKMEAEIDAISVRKAEKFKDFLTGQAPDTSLVKSTQMISPPLIKLSVLDLIRLGATSNHIQTFFIVLAFSVSFLHKLEEIFGDEVINYLKKSSTWLSMKAVIVTGLAVLFVSVFVSIARIVIRYFNFELSEIPNGFRVRSGLVNTKQYLVPYKKIQLFSWKANWLRRKVGLYTLEFQQPNREATGRKQRIKVPVTRQYFIGRLLTRYHDDIQQTADSVHRIQPVYAFRRMLIPGLPVTVVLVLIFFPWLSWNALYFSGYLMIQFVNAYFFSKYFRLYISEKAIEVKQGIWGREIRLMCWNKLQHFELKQSIYQRSANLATVILHTAGGSIKIPFITLTLAHAICNYALYKTEESTKSWM